MADKQKPNVERDDSIFVGVFDSLPAAQQAVLDLREAGFSTEQISLISSEARVAQLNRASQLQAGPESWKGAALFGAATGGVVASLVAVAALSAGAALPVVVAGGMASLLTGGVVGGLAGAMTERGFEPAAVDYYVMAVSEGRCLVAVEKSRSGHDRPSPAQAASILESAGSDPVRIPHSEHLQGSGS